MRALVLVPIVAALLGCASSGAGGGSGGEGALREFLETPPTDRLSAALVQGDDRYLATGGPTPTAPCAPDSARLPSRHFVIPGSGGDGTATEARDYACAYNKELATILGETPP